MQVSEIGLPGLKLIRPRRHCDERGWFTETFQRSGYTAAGIASDFAQDNLSLSRRGVLRGLHYQIRRPQGKLIRVVSGTIWDAVVDLRRKSPTFGQWFGLELSARNPDGDLEMFWVPEGFAHGFLALSDSVELQYKVTQPYDPGGEETLLWNDSALGIPWPLRRLDGMAPVISAKDRVGLRLDQATAFDF